MDVSAPDEIARALLDLKDSGVNKCQLLMAHNALQDGFVESGIPQINVDQLNDRHSNVSANIMTQEEFDRWFQSLPCFFYEVVNDEGGCRT